jgi:hypothetical protein
MPQEASILMIQAQDTTAMHVRCVIHEQIITSAGPAATGCWHEVVLTSIDVQMHTYILTYLSLVWLPGVGCRPVSSRC